MRKLQIALAAMSLTIMGFAGELHGQSAPSSTLVPPAAASALPAGPGHDTMVRVCSACHAPEIAARQRLSPAGWHEMVETMAGRGAQGSDADFAEITAYLATNFPESGKK